MPPPDQTSIGSTGEACDPRPCMNTIERHTVPLSEALRADLTEFWSHIFQTSFAELQDVLAGGEVEQNVDTIWIAREGATIAATCHLTVSRLDPRLGGLGEIATAPQFRGKGLAAQLVERAITEATAAGCSQLVLGTVNDAAARLYGKFGFRYLPGSRVMLRNADGTDGFGSAWFDRRDVKIVVGAPQHRLTIIPPILAATEHPILDANVGLRGTQLAEQTSCMGLYPRYDRLAKKGGQWFVAQGSNGSTVGIVSVIGLRAGIAQVDGFVVAQAGTDVLASLFQEATRWGEAMGFAIQSACGGDDPKKLAFILAQGRGHEETAQPSGCGAFPSHSLRASRV